MRWRGETTKQFWERVTNWHRAFAYLPVQLSDGTWVWWRYYLRRSENWGPTCLDIRWSRKAL